MDQSTVHVTRHGEEDDEQQKTENRDRDFFPFCFAPFFFHVVWFVLRREKKGWTLEYRAALLSDTVDECGDRTGWWLCIKLSRVAIKNMKRHE